MKKIFIVFILLSFTFGINANTKKKIIEDCNYLEQILTQAYVNYDEAASKGFNIDLLTKNIKLNYKNSFGYKKELDEENLGLLIALHTTDYLKSINIIDNHLVFKNSKFECSFFEETCAYYSKIYFEKKDLDYIVYSSDDINIKIGQKYTGNITNLKKTYFDNKLLYNYIVLTNESHPNIEISIENKSYPCKTKKACFEMNNQDIIYKETNSSIYIYLRDCYLGLKTPEKRNYIQKKYDDIIERIINSDVDKNVILDLRGNSGGYVEVLYNLIVPIFYKTRFENYPEFSYIISKSQNGQLLLHSTEINKAILRYQNDNNIKNKISEINTNRELIVTNVKNNPNLKLKKEKLEKKLYILIDQNTASAAEYGIAVSYLINGEKIILIGNKTFGAIETGDWYSYILPNSKLIINLSTRNHSREDLFINNSHWNGDTKGFFPDFWATEDTILENLITITNDNELTKILQ